MNRHLVYCGAGSNTGDRQRNLDQAAAYLEKDRGVMLIRKSAIHETLPMGAPNQPLYLNAVWELRTSCSPQQLLALFQEIEMRLGRMRSPETHWGPRPIDLDILFYDQLVLNEAGLTIPHPGIRERAFVLEPLCELASDWVHPVLDVTMDALRQALYLRS